MDKWLVQDRNVYSVSKPGLTVAKLQDLNYVLILRKSTERQETNKKELTIIKGLLCYLNLHNYPMR